MPLQGPIVTVQRGALGPEKLTAAAPAAGDAGLLTLSQRAPATPVALAAGAGTYANNLVDGEGKLILSGTRADPSQTKQSRTALTGVSNVQLLASAGAGLRNYITDITVENTGAAPVQFLLVDGASTVVWSCTVPATSSFNVDWETPLRLTAATVVNGQLGAAGTANVMISGYAAV